MAPARISGRENTTSLFSLPQEIRDSIYEWTLCATVPRESTRKDGTVLIHRSLQLDTFPTDVIDPAPIMPLLLTSRQVAAEITNFLFENFVFELQGEFSYYMADAELDHCVGMFNAEGRENLRHVTVRLSRNLLTPKKRDRTLGELMGFVMSRFPGLEALGVCVAVRCHDYAGTVGRQIEQVVEDVRDGLETKRPSLRVGFVMVEWRDWVGAGVSGQRHGGQRAERAERLLRHLRDEVGQCQEIEAEKLVE